ncbi:MAG: NAD(P)/FAD-dependent oxidoreductase [Candidatus Peribacteria bacterium]|nr:NAD(P)/FAD-dependent oxidoreductase [Candidatus Peribacteria bacterium]
MLFTHWGLSGPVIFNSTLAMQGLPPEQFTFKLSLPKAAITKRLLAYLGFSAPKLAHYTLTTKLHRLRPLTEAKVCGGGICGEQLTEQLEVKTVPGLFITGECLDVTGKTGGYNLQRCWTSGKVVAQALIANS